jgi:hypothetical protein
MTTLPDEELDSLDEAAASIMLFRHIPADGIIWRAVQMIPRLTREIRELRQQLWEAERKRDRLDANLALAKSNCETRTARLQGRLARRR